MSDGDVIDADLTEHGPEQAGECLLQAENKVKVKVAADVHVYQQLLWLHFNRRQSTRLSRRSLVAELKHIELQSSADTGHRREHVLRKMGIKQ